MILQQLLYFNKVAEYQNVTKAAEALYVSQPTLSRNIKQLEDELECKLFTRKGKSLLLTESGKILYARSTQILRELRQTQMELRELNNSDSEIITVQLRCVAGLFFDIMFSYIAQHQNIVFNILQNDNEGINSSEYDLFLYPSLSYTHSAMTDTLFRENIYVAMSENHPLAAKEELTAEDLNDQQFVSIASNRYFHKISQELREQYPQMLCNIFCDDMVAVRNLVRDHNYLTLLPEFTWQKPELTGIVLRSVRNMDMNRYVCLTTNNNRHLSAAAVSFRRYFLTELNKRGIVVLSRGKKTSEEESL